MISYAWYVSKLENPWERAVIANMVSALRGQGLQLEIYVGGGTADFCNDDVYSWNSLNAAERLKKIFNRRLWHLWGKPPFWWPVIRSHSRTVHTSFISDVEWKGHPTRLSIEQAVEGENFITPTFETALARVETSESAVPSIFCNLSSASADLKKILEATDFPVIDIQRVNFRVITAKSGLFISGSTPSEALLAAQMAMQGLTVAGPDSPFLKEFLGDEGYILVSEDETGIWNDAIKTAFSQTGKSLSVSTRHYLKTNYSPEALLESLMAVYKSVLGKEFL